MTVLLNAITIDPDNTSTGGGLLEEGKYEGSVTNCTEKKSAAGNTYLEVEFTLQNTRKIWHRFNLWNANPTAREIAQKEFNKLGVALDLKGMVSDTDQLFGRNLTLDIGVESGSGGYGDRNIALDYLPTTKGSSPPSAAKTIDNAVEAPWS